MSRFVTVFIPTLNGEEYLQECIEMVLKQKLPVGFELELLVIDSGSTDRTLSILQSFGDRLSLHRIPNSEFSHGGTRDKAARMAKGVYFLCLSQDASPANENWLMSMIEPFFISDKVGCVFGAQVPRSDAPVTIKREVAGTFGALGARDSIIIHRHASLVDGHAVNSPNLFFSDANSASRVDLLTSTVPFRHVNYAEDQALAQDMQAQGYLKAYAPQAEVWHSNMYTYREYFYRKFDEFIGLQESVGTQLPRSRKSLLLGWIRPTIEDYKWIRRDGSYSYKRKLKNYLQAPLYNLGSKRGQYYASKYLNDKAARDRLSLEKKLRA